jgi:hypothetical protein
LATIQRGTTKVANKLISYAEKRAVVRDGLECSADFAKTQFKATREMWGKNDEIQAHHVIQSFKPNEIDPEKANKIGMELAKKIAPGFEVAVYTHADKDHIHNHIVINSVNPETGKKYHAHGKDELFKIRAASDQLCLENDLSVVKEHNSPVRYTLAEKALLEKGEISWKDEVRQAIDHSKNEVSSFSDLEKSLKENFDIEMKLRGNTISFKHPEQKRFIRGKSLGFNYEMEGLEHEFNRQIERERGTAKSENPIKRNRGSERSFTFDSTRTPVIRTKHRKGLGTVRNAVTLDTGGLDKSIGSATPRVESRTIKQRELLERINKPIEKHRGANRTLISEDQSRNATITAKHSLDNRKSVERNLENSDTTAKNNVRKSREKHQDFER